MKALQVEKFDSPSEYLIELYNEWKVQDRENNLSKLSRLLGSDFDYSCIRRIMTGVSRGVSFDLFESIFRAICPDREQYLRSIQKWFPRMIAVADRISRSGIKPDQCFFLREVLDKEIYQELISGKSLSEKNIARRWGEEGVESLKRVLKSGHFQVDSLGNISVAIDDGYIRLGGHVTMNLVKHNIEKVTPENSGTGENLFSYRVLYLSDNKREMLREDALGFRSQLEKNYDEKRDGADGKHVVSIQIIMRTHSTDTSENKVK